MIPLYTALKLALPGVEIIYYGNKIGMIDTQVRLDQKKILFLSMLLCQKYFEIVHGCPMQWDNSINAGTLNFNPHIDTDN